MRTSDDDGLADIILLTKTSFGDEVELSYLHVETIFNI